MTTTYGGEGYVSVPDATTWDDITKSPWVSHGAGVTLWSGGPKFHLEYDVYPWSGSLSWTEDTVTPIESFSLQRSVKGWYEGPQAGGGTIVLDNTDEVAYDSNKFERSTRIKISVDIPEEPATGPRAIFTGFIKDTRRTYDSAGYSRLHLIMVDHMGYTGQAVFPALTQGAQTTGFMLHHLLTNYGAGVIAFDLTGITTASGLTQNGKIAAGNVVDKLSQYVRGELGMIFNQRGGKFKFLARSWWAGSPTPVATIGSLDRSGGGGRDDPAYGDVGYKFPGSQTVSSGPIGYNKFTWGYNTGSVTKDNSDARVGIRQKSDTTELNSATDATNGVNYLAGVEAHYLVDEDLNVTFPAEFNNASINYAALAEIGDFVEVARETQLRFDRQWQPAWVMGVHHRFNPATGWVVTLRTDPNLARWTAAVPVD